MLIEINSIFSVNMKEINCKNKRVKNVNETAQRECEGRYDLTRKCKRNSYIKQIDYRPS